MNFKNYIALALLVPVAIRAEFTAQKDGISIVVTAPTAGQHVLQAYGIPVKTEQFTAQKSNPVWIEVTNTSDRQIEISNRSINKTQIGSDTLLKHYKYRAILRPLLTWVAVHTARCIIFGHFTKWTAGKIGQKTGEAMAAAFTNQTSKAEYEEVQRGLMVEVQAYQNEYKTTIQINNAFGWGNFSAAIGSWWLFSSFNKELEVLLNQQLLQDSIMVAPGQTIKKLVVLDGTTTTNRFALSIFDARTHMVKSQFEVIL
jgi:hypothetical protein